MLAKSPSNQGSFDINDRRIWTELSKIRRENFQAKVAMQPRYSTGKGREIQSELLKIPSRSSKVLQRWKMGAWSTVDCSATFELRPLQSEGYKAPGPGNVRARREGGCTVQGEGGVGQCNHHCAGKRTDKCCTVWMQNVHNYRAWQCKVQMGSRCRHCSVCASTAHLQCSAVHDAVYDAVSAFWG